MVRLISVALLLSLMLVFTPSCESEATSQVLEDDLRLTLTANKAVYQAGEIVRVTATVENLTSEVIEYTLWNIGDPTPYIYLAPYVYLESNQCSFGFALEEEGNTGRVVNPMIIVPRLEPHEVVTREVVWDQKHRDLQAPQGTYTITCSIALGDYNQGSDSLKRLSVSVDINIVDAPQWITPEQAKDIALSLPEVREWREAHSGKYLLKEEDGYYLLIHDEWIKVDPIFTIGDGYQDLTLDDLPEWIPDADVSLEDGAWLVEMGTKLGMEPHFVKVWIDIEDGTVKDSLFS
jgi:hypothetical protein